MFKNQIIGITRFSIPSLEAFEVSRASIAECEAVLYAPDRLEKRFELFERFCLPSIANQTDKGFMALILIGEGLPQPYKDRLIALIDDVPEACIAEVAPDKHFKMINKVVHEIPALGQTHRTTFRLDDDDMVDVNYVARMRKTLDALSVVTPKGPFALAYHLGYYLDLAGNEPEFFELTENLPLGLGLSVTAPMAWRSNIYAWNHRFVPKKCNTYIDTRVPSFIRTMHSFNDAPRQAGFSGVAKSREEMEPILDEHFGLTWDDLTRDIPPTLNAVKSS